MNCRSGFDNGVDEPDAGAVTVPFPKYLSTSARARPLLPFALPPRDDVNMEGSVPALAREEEEEEEEKGVEVDR